MQGWSVSFPIPNSIYGSSAQANCEALGSAGDYASSIYGVLLGTVVACVVAFILVQVVGFTEDEEPETASGPSLSAAGGGTAPGMVSGPTTLYTPLNGEIKPLSEVNDPTFAQGILGQGVAIVPREGKLYSPCDGTVNSVFDTKHAIGLTSSDGVEMLIHIGLDTVSLNGKCFTAKVKDGQAIHKGDLLIEFDIDGIKKAGLDTITPVLVVNADDFAGIQPISVKIVVTRDE